MAIMSAQTQGGRAWLRAETRLGRRAAGIVVLIGLLGTAMGVVQGGTIALILGRALIGRMPAPWWAIGLFCIAALLRAAWP